MHKIKSKETRTKRNVIDERTSRMNLIRRELNPPFGIGKQPIITLVLSMSISYSEDQLPLKAEHTPNNLGG
jgi:hypothetical protein